jgi:hypothetical protein
MRIFTTVDDNKTKEKKMKIEYTSAKGNKAMVDIDVKTGQGTITAAGTVYTISGIAVIKGETVAVSNGNYIRLPKDIYNQINDAMKAEYAANMTEREIKDMCFAIAEQKYNKLFAQGADPVAIINARNEMARNR